jgi:phosphoribosylformimino-5-aminoimidazole carboxamide ribotide isomerase
VQLLPVLDLRQGVLVHARAGRREEYQPLRSCWTPDASNPLLFTEALRRQLGCRCFYLADLDALAGQHGQREAISALLAAGHRLWLDAGIRTLEQAQAWREQGLDKLILASESLPTVRLLRELAREVDPNWLVLSLDSFQGKFRGPADVDEGQLVAAAVSMGILHCLVLDISHVGAGAGPQSAERCRALQRSHPRLRIITGGGIRHGHDLDRLAEAGVEVALVATALHKGGLQAEDWRRYPFVEGI